MSKNIERSGVYVDARALYKELYSNAFFKKGFTYKERLIKKYNLKIKNHGSKKLQNKTEAA